MKRPTALVWRIQYVRFARSRDGHGWHSRTRLHGNLALWTRQTPSPSRCNETSKNNLSPCCYLLTLRTVNCYFASSELFRFDLFPSCRRDQRKLPINDRKNFPTWPSFEYWEQERDFIFLFELVYTLIYKKRIALLSMPNGILIIRRESLSSLIL